jgi:tRNA 2-selenouridine synthase SelU
MNKIIKVKLNISIEDIANAVTAEPEKTEKALLSLMLNLYEFMEQIPKTVIDNLSEKNTVLINDFFAQQAERFNVIDDCEQGFMPLNSIVN